MDLGLRFVYFVFVRLPYSIWRAADPPVRVELPGNHSPIVTADDTHSWRGGLESERRTISPVISDVPGGNTDSGFERTAEVVTDRRGRSRVDPRQFLLTVDPLNPL